MRVHAHLCMRLCRGLTFWQFLVYG